MDVIGISRMLNYLYNRDPTRKMLYSVRLSYIPACNSLKANITRVKSQGNLYSCSKEVHCLTVQLFFLQNSAFKLLLQGKTSNFNILTGSNSVLGILIICF